MYPHIRTASTTTIIIDAKPHAVTTDHTNYGDIMNIVNNMAPSAKVDATLLELIRPVNKFIRIFGDGSTGFEIHNNTLRCIVDGEDFPLAPSLHQEILDVYNENGNLTSLYNFIVKLSKNPRREVITELWQFISACGLALTESGNFLAYKSVRSDYTDLHTGEMDNSPGTVVKMPRWQVEHDPNRVCAAGLHFAAWEYVYGFGSSDAVRMILSISPEDVVSIPADYSAMKGRACKYTVLREVNRPEELKGTKVFTESAETMWLDNTNENISEVAEDAQVEVKLMNGDFVQGAVSEFNWSNALPYDMAIVRFRYL